MRRYDILKQKHSSFSAYRTEVFTKSSSDRRALPMWPHKTLKLGKVQSTLIDNA